MHLHAMSVRPHSLWEADTLTGEETNTSHHDCSHMIPTEWGLVNLSERKATTLIGIIDMSILFKSQH